MKIETIDITAHEYFDKINGNTYFNANIYINYNSPDAVKIHIPFEYGHSNQYIQAALIKLNKLNYINTERPLWEYCKENNIALRRQKIEGFKERELKQQDKELIALTL
jgi:hypothetical protein